MTWEQPPASRQTASLPPASDKVIGILASIVYGACCMMQGVGVGFAAMGPGGQAGPEVTSLQFGLTILGFLVTAGALVSGVMLISSNPLGFLLGVVSMIGSIAVNVFSIFQMPEQMKTAADAAEEQAKKDGTPMPPEMLDMMLIGAYIVSAVVILINVLYLVYCAARYSQIKGSN